MTLFTDLQAAGLPVLSATDGGPATFSRSLNETEMEIYFNLADPNRPIQKALWELDKAQLKAEYVATIARLQQIENAAAPTNPQVIAAIRDMAKFQRLILKLLAKLY